MELGRRRGAQLRGRRVVLVGADDPAARRPARAAPGAALGDDLGLAARRVDDDQVEAVAPPADGDQARAVGVPGELQVIGARARQLALLGAGEVQLVEAAALGRVRDRRPIGRPRRAVVVHVRRPRHRAHRAAVEGGDADLARAVEVGARGEGVGDLGRVGGDGGLALVAVRVELAVCDREASRPRVGDVDHRQAGRVVAFDRDDEARVVDPQRAAALDQLARRAAGGGHEPHVVAVGVGDGRAVRGQPGRRVGPVGDRLAPAGQALGGTAGLEVEQIEVGGLGRRLDEDGLAGAHAQRMRARRVGDRLQAPVRRRLDVLARLGENALVLVLADPHRLSHPCPPPGRSGTRAPALRSCRGRSRPPGRRRWGGPTSPARGRRRGSPRR